MKHPTDLPKRLGSAYDSGKPMEGFGIDWIMEHVNDEPTESDILEAKRQLEVEKSEEC